MPSLELETWRCRGAVLLIRFLSYSMCLGFACMHIGASFACLLLKMARSPETGVTDGGEPCVGVAMDLGLREEESVLLTSPCLILIVSRTLSSMLWSD